MRIWAGGAEWTRTEEQGGLWNQREKGRAYETRERDRDSLWLSVVEVTGDITHALSFLVARRTPVRYLHGTVRAEVHRCAPGARSSSSHTVTRLAPSRPVASRRGTIRVGWHWRRASRIHRYKDHRSRGTGSYSLVHRRPSAVGAFSRQCYGRWIALRRIADSHRAVGISFARARGDAHKWARQSATHVLETADLPAFRACRGRLRAVNIDIWYYHRRSWVYFHDRREKHLSTCNENF